MNTRILFLLLFLPFLTRGQNTITMQGSPTTHNIYRGGTTIDSQLMVPYVDTSGNKFPATNGSYNGRIIGRVVVRPQDSLFYIYTNNNWRRVATYNDITTIGTGYVKYTDTSTVIATKANLNLTNAQVKINRDSVHYIDSVLALNRNSTLVSSASILKYTKPYTYYIRTGAAVNDTLPSVSGNVGTEIITLNRGTGNDTVWGTIYNNTAATYEVIPPGQLRRWFNDGTYWTTSINNYVITNGATTRSALRYDGYIDTVGSNPYPYLLYGDPITSWNANGTLIGANISSAINPSFTGQFINLQVDDDSKFSIDAATGNVTTGGNVVAGTTIQAGTSSSVRFGTTRARIRGNAQSSGTLMFQSSADTLFDKMIFGGNTTGNPALSTFSDLTNPYINISDGSISGQNTSLGVGVASMSLSAKLQVDATTKGFLMPRMTTTQKNAISSPATGLQVYDVTVGSPYYYNGTSWVQVGAGGGSSQQYGDTTSYDATKADVNTAIAASGISNKQAYSDTSTYDATKAYANIVDLKNIDTSQQKFIDTAYNYGVASAQFDPATGNLNFFYRNAGATAQQIQIYPAIAAPSTIPSNTVTYYFPSSVGTYTNFTKSGSPIVISTLSNGLTLLARSGSEWDTLRIPFNLNNYYNKDQFTKFLDTTNKFDKTTMVMDSVIIATNGVLTASTFSNDQIVLVPATPGSMWTLSNMSTAVSSKRFAFYNSSLACVSCSPNSIGITANATYTSAAAPALTAYVGFTLWRQGTSGTNPVDNVQVELGSSATAYKTYQRKRYINKIDGYLTAASLVPEYFPADTYQARQLVSYNNEIYMSLNDTNYLIPTNTARWSKITPTLTSTYLDSAFKANETYTLDSSIAKRFPYKVQYVNGEYLTNFNWNFLGNIGASQDTIYVDPVSGSDANPGTLVSPKKSPKGAYDASGDVILFKPGIYLDTNGWRRTIVTRSLYLNTYGGAGKAYFTTAFSRGQLGLSYFSSDPTYTNTYAANYTSTANTLKFNRIVDTANRDTAGFYRCLTSVISPALCNSTTGSTYWDTTNRILYVNKIGLDTTALLLLADTANFRVTGTASIYMQNMGFIGGGKKVTGTTPQRVVSFDGNMDVVMDNCFVGYGAGYDALAIKDTVRAYYKNLTMAYGLGDGLNYEEKCFGLEWNIRVYDMGSEFADNASTAHGYARVLRIGGKYLRGYSRVIQDIEYVKCINIGLTSGYSILGDEAFVGGPTANNDAGSPTVAFWINCTSVGPAKGWKVNAPATNYFMGGNFSTSNANIGAGAQYYILNSYVSRSVYAMQQPISPNNIPGVPEYSGNTTAKAAGLVVGDVYRTGETLKIVY